MIHYIRILFDISIKIISLTIYEGFAFLRIDFDADHVLNFCSISHGRHRVKRKINSMVDVQLNYCSNL